MSANYPLSLTVGLPETHLPNLRARSRSKLTSSSMARPQAATAPRREKLTRDPRSKRGHCITKILTSHDGSVSAMHHHQSTSQREYASGRLGQAGLFLHDRHAVQKNGENNRALRQFDSTGY
ncbi:hypothetical protein B296_00019764 [Ensete ventricosum]|uniref:Uncharacterized protein n=1 Tax=Ensete ventricosum TaxID=4639 RepID=A0A426XJJ5_ENSVE|nr:hypothetical protein B296_00019764 [Ensete ventricosum]